MALLGAGAVAMWWDMAPALRAEFEDWHSHEHFPERMSIPGFRRGSRWSSENGGEGFFVLYELQEYETLVSPHYLARLNDPTPWSKKMMPHHRNMVRSQCRVSESFGGGVARFMMTLRFSPAPGEDGRLQESLTQTLQGLPNLPGLTGSHLLRTATPDAAETTEQKIRGGDAVADWIVLVSGYEPDALAELAGGEIGPSALERVGALPSPAPSLYRLSYCLASSEV
jgi:hypothetical protein